jgi:hypothetical protein
MHSRSKLLVMSALFSVVFLVFVGVASANSWDVANNFSLSANPNGQWSYGYSLGLTGSLTLYNTAITSGTLESWNYGSVSDPNVVKNTSSSPVTPSSPGTVTWPGNGFSLHPGSNGTYPSGTYSHAVWTSPATGLYSVSATFTGWSIHPPNPATTTDVYISVNGGSVFNEEINISPYGNSVSFTPTVYNIPLGATVDFAVGEGSDLTYYYDTTGLAARISSVPLPPSALLLGSGLLGLGLLRRKWSLKK